MSIFLLNMIKFLFFVKNFSMKKWIFILQEVIKISLLFTLSFIWLRFSNFPVWFDAILAIGISLFATLFLNIFSAKKRTTKIIKEKEKLEAENMFFSLATKGNSISFLYNLFSIRHKNTSKTKEYVKFPSNNNFIIVYPHLFFHSLSPDDIVKIIQKTAKEKKERLIICCESYSQESLIFIKKLKEKIILLDQYETYLYIYKEYEYFPEITDVKESKRKSFKAFFYSVFSREKAKNYLFVAGVILLSSFFVKMNLYYTILSTLLILFSLICFFTPQKSIAKSNQPFN